MFKDVLFILKPPNIKKCVAVFFKIRSTSLNIMINGLIIFPVSSHGYTCCRGGEMSSTQGSGQDVARLHHTPGIRRFGDREVRTELPRVVALLRGQRWRTLDYYNSVRRPHRLQMDAQASERQPSGLLRYAIITDTVPNSDVASDV